MSRTKENAPIENIENAEKHYARFSEETKLLSDFLKHIATLDTGVIVVITTFFNNFNHPYLGLIITISLICFAISLTSIVISHFILVNTLAMFSRDLKRLPLDIDRRLYMNLAYIAATGFLSGFSLLIGFAVSSGLIAN